MAATTENRGAGLSRAPARRRRSRAGRAPRSRAVGWALDAAALVGFGVFLIVLWQLAYELELVSRFALPSPSATGEELWIVTKNIFEGGYVFDATLYTLYEIVLGFLLAFGTGLVLGIIAGDTRFGQKVLMPYLVGVNVMPRIAFAPVFVAWLGFGLAPKVLMAAFIAFFPMVINTALGVRSSSANSLLLFRSMEAGRLKTLLKLKLPNALPYIFAGMKTAMVLSVIGAIVAEFLGGSAEGVGELIAISAEQLAIDKVFALIIVLSVVGMLLYGLIVLLERRVVRWNADQQGGAGVL
jgi:NitT/TauT family transport system permease protein